MFPFLHRIFTHQTAEDEHYRNQQQRVSAFKIILVTAMGGFLYGYDTGIINDILEMKYVYTHFPSDGEGFSTHERAIIVAILSLGTFCGALIAPWISDTYGRKFTIMVAAGILFNIGNILQISAAEVALLCVGRFVSGISIGCLSASIPLFQAEVSHKRSRGSVVFTYQFSITFGLLVSSAISQGTRKLHSSGSYRIPVGLQFGWALLLFVGMLFLPESPRFYVQKNDLQKALDSLCKLRRLPPEDEEVIEELVDIKANYDYELSYGKTTFLDCFRSGGGRHKQGLRMWTGMGVQFFQQCSGINFIFYYGVNFFLSTGINNYYLMSFITYLVNVIFTIPGIMLIDVIGRRPLLFWGGVGMAVSNFIIAICGVSINDSQTNAILCVSFACLFIAFFASTWGGSTWALCSDIYGISVRQKAFALTAATNWIVNFVFAYITPYLIDTGEHTAAIGSKIFFMWGSLNAAGAFFVFFTVYETKGLKLEEVDFMYAHCSNPRVSKKFKSTKIDFAHLDENYNPIPQEHVPDSTSSNDVYNDKRSSEIPSPQQLELQPLYYNKNQNDLTIIPYNNIISPTSTTSTNELESRRQSILSHRELSSIQTSRSRSTAQRSTSRTSAISNDYQEYLDSINREYSQHYQNSASMIKQLSHNSNSNSSNHNIISNHEIQQSSEEEKRPSFNEVPLSVNNIPTTIIATPYFEQPPSDSDSSDESDDESDDEQEPRVSNEKEQSNKDH